MTSRLVDAPASTEDTDVEDWRVERFAELGFEKADALLLAVAGADWHEASALLERGCDVDTALRILA